jgi:predicted nucleic acid-binding protein
MKTLLDTTILVHSHNRASRYQKKAASIIEKAISGELEAYITPQILYEFFAIITNPRRVETPLPVDVASDICLDLLACREIGKVEPGREAPREVLRFAKELGLAGAEIFDCLIAVTAKENGIKRIYTENVDHFKRYKFLKAVNPLV